MSAAGRYNFIGHLASAIWLNHDPRRSWIAMFTAYYDASGSQTDPDGKILYIVGIVSTVRKWSKLEPQWNAVLRCFDVPYFHMKEFTAGIGPFAPWRHEEEKRANFLASLFRVIKRGVHKSFGHGLPVSSFREVNTVYQLSENYGGAYCLCAGACVNRIKKWVTLKYPGQRILHVFEKGDQGQNDLGRFLPIHEAVEPIPLPKINPATGEWFVPLQVADLIAWEVRRGVSDFLGGVALGPRESLRALIKTLPTDFKIQEAHELKALAEYWNIPKRS